MEIRSWLSEEEYSYVFDRVPRLCVDLLIPGEGGVLMTLRSIEPYKGEWHLPGGMIRRSESVEAAGKRIAKKETGLDIEIVSCLGYMEFPEEVGNGRTVHTISIGFLARAIGGTLHPDSQSKEARYFKDLPENTVRTHKDFAERHFQKLSRGEPS